MYHLSPPLSSNWDLPKGVALRKIDTSAQLWHRPRVGAGHDRAPVNGTGGLGTVITCVEYMPALFMAVGFADGTVEVKGPVAFPSHYSM